MSVSELTPAPIVTNLALVDGLTANSVPVLSPTLPVTASESLSALATHESFEPTAAATIVSPQTAPHEVTTVSNGTTTAGRAERRQLPRSAYDVLFGIAPYDENEPEGHQNFTIVHGCDVSPTGVGLFAMAPMKPQLVVIAMGTSKLQPIYALAKVIHSTPIEKFGTQGFLIGCQLIKRLKRSRNAHGVESVAEAAAQAVAAFAVDGTANVAINGAAVVEAPITSSVAATADPVASISTVTPTATPSAPA